MPKRPFQRLNFVIISLVVTSRRYNEKDNIIAENAQILVSDTTYNSMDREGYPYLDGVATGKKL